MITTIIAWIVAHQTLVTIVYAIGIVLDFFGQWFSSELGGMRVFPSATAFFWPIFWIVTLIKVIIMELIWPTIYHGWKRVTL